MKKMSELYACQEEKQMQNLKCFKISSPDCIYFSFYSHRLCHLGNLQLEKDAQVLSRYLFSLVVESLFNCAIFLNVQMDFSKEKKFQDIDDLDTYKVIFMC